ncbi:ABC transporter ATP-binding protein [Ruminococcus sp.]|uniref:ABC transporter ATP-binding protein n=1 Tax=Ruminococcus sp. TaxID=41978 RepID=UPI001B27669D|nr:ABC transporter ATP-binding protein [Ruminococcus sp.]MBO5558594.1 ABC transporter ATP-binding protein [Ruminococcus sp.]
MRKKVKITPYTKEKHKAAVEKDKADKKARKYHLWDNLRYVFGEGWRLDKLIVITILLEFVLEKSAEFAGIFCDKYIVDFVVGGSERRKLLITAVILLAMKYLFNAVNALVARYNSWTGCFNYIQHINLKLARKNLYTDYQNIEQTANNDTLNKAKTAANQVVYQMLNNTRQLLGNIASLLAFGGILAYLDPVIPLIALFFNYLVYKIYRHKMMWIWNMEDNWQGYDRQIGYINRSMSDLTRAKDVRIFGMQKFFRQLMDRSFGKRLDWHEQRDEWEFRQETLLQAVNWTGWIVIYSYVIFKVFHSDHTAGDIVLYINSAVNLGNTIYNLFDSYNGFVWQSQNISYTREYDDMPDKTNRGQGEPLPTDDYEIEFRNVSYTYFKADEPTIRNLSFTLKTGERLALVGLNGAGKTTLIKLMCGLYDPTEGEILLNGKAVNSYNRDEYFTLFSAVFQDIEELPASIAENISGTSYENADKARLEKCLKQSGLYEKIESLPDKEKTKLVRSLYDDAIELSGGQKQKMALAKALYKNAPILLLDEPTAALDPIAEQEMYLQYADFSKAKASVFISHRLASTRFCDRIILLENGEIGESGTHSELMEKGGKYAELFALQSSYYK